MVASLFSIREIKKIPQKIPWIVDSGLLGG